MLGAAFANYFLQNPNVLIIKHQDNYNKINDNYKHLAIFLVDSNGYLRVNYTGRQTIYIGNNSLHNYFSDNFLGECCRPDGSVNKYRARNFVRQIETLYKYQLISTLNRSDYWFDTYAFTISEKYELPKKVVVEKNNFQATDYFRTEKYTKSLTNVDINTIKNVNNFDKYVEDAKLDDVANESERSYFLYDNQNLIQETFISEIQKQVYLLENISFFGKIESDGKLALIKTENKL